jgi:hypothetical protein
MAFAYTTLRDNFELPQRSVPLFVQTVAVNLFGFPAPAQYIGMSGWAVDRSSLGWAVRVAHVNFGTLNIPQVTTEDDIVKHCLERGFALRRKANSTWLPEAQYSALAIQTNSRVDDHSIPASLHQVLDRDGSINYDFTEFSLVEIFGADAISSLPPQWPGLTYSNTATPALAQPQPLAQPQTQQQSQAQVQQQAQAPTNP